MRDIGFVPNLTKRASKLRAEGIPTWALRGDEFDSPFHGLHGPAGVGVDRTATRVADAIGLMTSGCVLTGWASRWLQGQRYCDGEL